MFKLAKEAYKVLNGMENRKIYDIGIVKPPPRGWNRDLDERKFRGLKSRGAAGVGGRGQVRGGNIVRGAAVPVPRGGITVTKSSVNVSVGRGNQNVQDSISVLAVTGLDGWSKDQTLPTGWKLDMVSNK